MKLKNTVQIDEQNLFQLIGDLDEKLQSHDPSPTRSEKQHYKKYTVSTNLWEQPIGNQVQTNLWDSVPTNLWEHPSNRGGMHMETSFW